jgi:hypothetical protein
LQIAAAVMGLAAGVGGLVVSNLLTTGTTRIVLSVLASVVGLLKWVVVMRARDLEIEHERTAKEEDVFPRDQPEEPPEPAWLDPYWSG